MLSKNNDFVNYNVSEIKLSLIEKRKDIMVLIGTLMKYITIKDLLNILIELNDIKVHVICIKSYKFYNIRMVQTTK